MVSSTGCGKQLEEKVDGSMSVVRRLCPFVELAMTGVIEATVCEGNFIQDEIIRSIPLPS